MCFGSDPVPTVKFHPKGGPQLPATFAAVRGVFTFSWRGAGAVGPRRGPRRLNNKRGEAKRQEDRTMSKGPGPGGSAASSAPPAATAQVLQAQPEKPQHYTYVEPPPAARARLTSAASVSHARRESARLSPPPPFLLQLGPDRFQPARAGPSFLNCHQPLVGPWGGKLGPSLRVGKAGARSRVHTSQGRPWRPECSSDRKTTGPGSWRARSPRHDKLSCVAAGPRPV